MNFAKRIWFTVGMAALICGCAPKVFYKSAWQSAPVKADGHLDEWATPLKFYDPDTKSSFSVSNDNKNLYVCLQATDPAVIYGLAQRGLQLWIDTTGKKEHQVGIICPLPQVNNGQQNGQRQRGGGYGGGGYRQGRGTQPTQDTAKEIAVRRHFLESVKRAHVSGFKTATTGVINLPDTVSGINIGVTWDGPDQLIYEFVIPLNSFYHPPVLPGDTLKAIGISLNFTSVPKNTNGNGGGGGGGGISPSFGIGMGGFGMMMGGGGGRRGGGYAQEPEAKTIWLPVHLSEKQ
jgi:hypothetical protein